jgi:5S rRNA maturation endonuclease (ribonuclease M5)
MDFINIISPQYIREYLDANFKGCGKFSSNEREYIMQSPFVDDDWKHKFSINVETGMWQDFKAHRQGNFAQLVAHVEKISYKRAASKIFFDNAINEYAAPLLRKKEEAVTKLDVDTSSWIPIDLYSCYHKNPLVQLAWKILWERKLFNVEYVDDAPFYFALEGRYKNRIIIPFKKPDESLFYFQARAMLASDYPKYLNPESTQARSSVILYPFKNDEPVLLCEGPLDAISLQLAGVNATATMGSSPSRFQIETLKDSECNIIVAYDNDTAGTLGADKTEDLRKDLMLPGIKICPPPSQYKDWNEAWQKDFDIKKYVETNTKSYDAEYLVNANIESW